MSLRLTGFLAICSLFASPGSVGAASAVSLVTIDVAAGPTGHLTGDESLGAGIDGMAAGEVERLFTPFNVRRMLSAGLGPISYRLRTELAIEAWHWSEQGAWSDAARQQGYWISSDQPSKPVLTTFGYALPRRGDSIDQAANQGYSRLDDGDLATFWKSNPYLDPRYAGEASAAPQWAVVAFDAPQSIDAARIQWSRPFARRYAVQYWVGADEYDDEGRWVTFPGGAVDEGRGGDELLRLAASPVKAKFLRVLLLASSGAGPVGSADPRDAMGFAIAEIGFGSRDADGRFVDAVRHAPDGKRQTVTFVSSTDPWHRAIDRDANLEQPGFDRVFQSGLTRGLPMMTPVGALYDTPENAAAEIRFLKRRGYLVRQIEIGEEPDGQNVAPEDFAALYMQFAHAVHAVDPGLAVGGPSLQGAVSDVWLDSNPDRSWTRRFIAALAARGRLADLAFFSFEHYPFDNLCGPLDRKLLAETRLMDGDLAHLRADGVPAAIPWIVTEYGFSAFGGRGEVELPGALINADIAAHFLSLGGASAYLFGYGPNRPYRGGPACAGYGNLMLFEADAQGHAREPMPAFHGARLLTQEWLRPAAGSQALYAAKSDLRSQGEDARITAYAARGLDGQWSVLLINRDPRAAHLVRIGLRLSVGKTATPLDGPYAVTQYSQAQYAWLARGEEGRPVRDLPPRSFVSGRGGAALSLPAYSVTVVRSDPAPRKSGRP